MDLISRAKAICLTPATEWPVIAEETTPTSTLITGYVLPLAAIGAVAGLIGGSLIGYSVPFVGTYRTPIVAGLGAAILGLVLSVVACFVIGWVVNALAPTFGAEQNQAQALKVVVYSYTPAWVAGILQILPMLGLLGVLAALYGIYLLYLGLPRLMKCPEDKALGYTVVTVVCAIVLSVVIGLVTAAVVGAGAIGAGMMGARSAPAAADPDSPLGRLEQLGQQLDQSARRADEAAARGDAAGQTAAALEGLGAIFGGGRRVEPLAIDRLEAFVPATFAGLAVVDRSGDRSGMGGLMVTTVEAEYRDGDRQVDLTIVDSGGISGLAGLASWAAGIESERRDASGSERTYRQNGRLIHERSSTTGGTNEFGIMAGDRFMVTATSQSLSLDALKAAVSTLNLAGLEALKDEGVQR